MFQSFFIAIFLYFFLVENKLYATTEKKINLKIILQKTLNDSPQIKQEGQVVDQYMGLATAAKGEFDLKLVSDFTQYQGNSKYYQSESSLVLPLTFTGMDLFTSYRKTTKTLPSYFPHGVTPEDGQYSFGFNLSLLQGLIMDKERFDLQSSQYLFDSKKYGYNQKTIEIIIKTFNAYFDYAQSFYKEKIYAEVVTIAKDRQKILEIKLSKGNISDMDLWDNERQILQRKSEQEDYELKSKNYLRDLSLVLNDTTFLQDHITPELEEHKNFIFEDLEKLKQDAIENRGDLFAIKEEIKAKELELSLKKQNYLPKLNLKAEVLHDNEEQEINQTSINQDEYRVLLNFEMPLFLSKARGEFTKVKSELEYLKIKQQFLEQDIRIQLEKKLHQIKILFTRLEMSNQEVAYAEKIKKAELKKFQIGVSSLLNVNIREQDYAQAKLRAIDLFYQLWKSKMDLYLTLGKIPEIY